MIERSLTLTNRLGLHVRAAAKLVHTAAAYKAKVTLSKDGQDVDAKSILGILGLAAPIGSSLVFRVEGSDEEEAIQALADLIENRFGEAS